MCEFFVRRSKGKKYNPKLYPMAGVLKAIMEKPETPEVTEVPEETPPAAATGRCRSKSAVCVCVWCVCVCPSGVGRVAQNLRCEDCVCACVCACVCGAGVGGEPAM